jgi:V8-like Glu-specific endopeptidase
VRRLILVVATMMGVAFLLASVAALGITNGTPDANTHPNVGALVDIARRGDPQPYCTGTLISPTVFLTAAHCYPERGNTSYVTFDEETTSTLYLGTFHDNPNRRNDIAVVVFDEPIEGIEPAQLPTEGRFDNLQKGQEFTAVGYGGHPARRKSGRPVIAYDDQREWAVSAFKSVNPAHLRLSQNQNEGYGGTCIGDSGGPNFFGADQPASVGQHQGAVGGVTKNETDVIAGITITGDYWCRKTSVNLRLDTKSPRDFLGNYVMLP